MDVTVDQVRRHVDDWRDRAGLAPEHEVEVRVFDTEASQPDKSCASAPGSIDVEDGFERSVLEIHAWRITSDAHLEWVVLHELLHVHTARVAAVLEAHVEDVALATEHDLIRKWLRSLWRARYGCEPIARHARRGAGHPGVRTNKPRPAAPPLATGQVLSGRR